MTTEGFSGIVLFREKNGSFKASLLKFPAKVELSLLRLWLVMFSKIRDAGDECSGSRRRGDRNRNQNDRKSSGRLLLPRGLCPVWMQRKAARL